MCQVSYLNRVLDLSPVGGVLLGDGDGEEEARAGVERAVAQEQPGGLRHGGHAARGLEAAPVARVVICFEAMICFLLFHFITKSQNELYVQYVAFAS